MQTYKQNRSGAVLPLAATLMVAMILVLGLMVEMSWLNERRFEAQSASDLATRSALAKLYDNTKTLDQTAVDQAKAVGLQVQEANFSTGGAANDSNLRFGHVLTSKQTGLPTFFQVSKEKNFRQIKAARMSYDHQFVSLLGTLLAKVDINLPTVSRAETSRFEMVLCLDASRSMARNSDPSRRFPVGGGIDQPPISGSRWFTLIDSVNDFLDGFVGGGAGAKNDARTALVTFGGGILGGSVASPLDGQYARTELGMASISKNAPLIEQNMIDYTQQYPALGLGTSIYSGIELSLDVLEQSPTPASQYIVLFSDGERYVKNAIQPIPPSELESIQRAVDLGIPIYTIAYDADVRNLRKIAEDTGGLSYFAQNKEELSKAFKAISSSLSTRITE